MTGSDIKMLCAAKKAEVVRETAKFVEVRRGDAFTVFLDKYDESSPDAELLGYLNAARLHADPEDVILLVGIVRGLQISRVYAARESVAAEKILRRVDAIAVIRAMIEGKGQRKRQRRITVERGK